MKNKSGFSKLSPILILAAALPLTSARADLQQGLVSYWPMDAITGTNTADLSFGNNFNVNGAVTVSAGKFNNALTFASGQFLSLFNNASATNGLPIYTTNGYTIAFWVKAASQANNHYVLTEGNITNSNPLLCFQTAGTTAYTLPGQTGNFTNGIDVILRAVGNTPINHVRTKQIVFDNNWHHVAWVDINGQVSFYIDGTNDPQSIYFTYTNIISPVVLNSTAVGGLIRNTTNSYAAAFVGSVDDVALWERPLSQAEVLSVMSNSIPTPVIARAPVITSTLTGKTNALGDYATMSVTAINNRLFNYQWFNNNIAIPNQTNSTIILPTVVAGSNIISVTVSNSVGSASIGPVPFVVTPDAAPALLSGLVSYWPFNTVSNSATSTPDLVSQNDFQLNNISSSNLVAGQFGEALAFDGATQYGQESTGTPVYDLSGNYTIAFWVKGAAASNVVVFANANSATANAFTIGSDTATVPDGKLDVKISTALSDTISTATVFDANWHHVVWVDQNGVALLYVDGVLDATPYSYAHPALGTPALNNTSVGAALISGAAKNFFGGDIDDLGIWNRRLSYTEIQSIFSSGIPTPPTIIKPSVASLITQPATLATGVYQGDSVSLTVNASGTPPFAYQWLFNTAPISAVLNASATNNVLLLSSVTPANTGNYSVIITNAGGSITSSVVPLSVIPYVPATNGTVLQVEFNAAAGPVVQPGFGSMTLSGNPATFSGPKITLSTIGATTLADRIRTVPVNNPPALNTADIYSQIIFSTANTPNTGIDILVQRLAPNTSYGVTFWSWDSANSGLSDWVEVSSGSPIIFNGLPGGIPVYDFVGSVQPKADFDDTLGALLTSSSAGTLEFQATVDPENTAITVFLNALRLIANPTIQVANSVVAADGNLQLTVTTQYPNQTIEFEESPDLSPGSWASAGDATVTGTHGPVVTVEFPLSSTQMFYRVKNP